MEFCFATIFLAGPGRKNPLRDISECHAGIQQKFLQFLLNPGVGNQIVLRLSLCQDQLHS